ncbi:MAG: DNA repair protein RecN [Flavobacteriales bacterium]|nr:DNA repair protein RecN [Flavobacteriales bacterium]
MLLELKVKNYALIQDLTFTPGDSFNVITGETGSGKSILLGALGLVLGERADSYSIRENTEKCIIEAEFEIGKYNLLDWFIENDFDHSEKLSIRREINTSGKSRIFINDTPAQLSQVRELGLSMIDIHSQHDNLSLFNKKFQFDVLDAYAGQLDVCKNYAAKFHSFNKLNEKLKLLEEKENKGIQEKEFLEWQLNELVEAAPGENEQELLDAEYKELSNAENTLQKLSGIFSILNETENPVLSVLNLLRNEIDQVAKNDTRFSDLSKRIDVLNIELKDISSEIEVLSDKVRSDPERLSIVNERLSLLHQLSRKHGTEDLKQKIFDLEDELALFDNLSSEIFTYRKDLEVLHNEALLMANLISSSRSSHLHKLEEEINLKLKDLGMPGASIMIELTQNENSELSLNGLNEISILFSPAKGKQYNPIQNIASGGEISRLMLILKSVLATKNALPTLIFDEIDTGVSGEVAIRMAEMLEELSLKIQIIVITHLPQIASKGNKHFTVFKKQYEMKTVTDIKELTKEERVNEIAEMIGGKSIDESIRASARHLLKV